MFERSERLVCRFCGEDFTDRRGLQLPGLEDSPAEFCPTCKAGMFVVTEDDFFGHKKGEVCVISDIRPIRRRHDPRRRGPRKERSRV